MSKRHIGLAASMALGLGMLLLISACGPTLEPKMYYQGRLLGSRGNPIDGERDLTFHLYSAETEGTALWSETHNDVGVANGLFSVVLGETNPLDVTDFHLPLWLETVVGSQTLSARQPLYGAPYAFSLVPGGVVRGDIDKTDEFSATMTVLNIGDGQGLVAWADAGVGAYVEAAGQTRSNAALRVYNRNLTQGMATYMENKSDYATAHFDNTGSGQVLYLTNGGTNSAGTGGGDFVTARNQPESDSQFRVLTSGQVRSDVGFNTPAGDMAEMLPAVPGLEPGETLVIGADGRLERSCEPYQLTVVGVYSTRPGFVGGQPVDDELRGHVPLAVAGIVPVKVTAENGPIRPGDMLTTSSTPGHAMCATVASPGTILGKALSALESGRGVVDVLIMLR